jgi:transposase-like protein
MEIAGRRGGPIPPLTLTDSERTLLEQWGRRRTTAQALALRSRIVLAAASGESNQAVAEHLRVRQQTVGKWRRRFLARRLAGLSDELRPGVPPTITDAQVEGVVAKTLDATPRDAT